MSYTHTADGVSVELGDGSTVEADVLVGSDGIWSAVRAQMYDEGPVKAKSADGLTQQGCPYSGYTVFAGEFVPESSEDFSDYYECGYKVYIGPKKYFVTSDVGNGRVQWYSFLAQPPGTDRAGDSWEGGESSEAQGADVISYLKQLHEGWTDEIHYVLDSTPVQNVEQRDLYDRWPEFRRSWADRSVVLVGDAVHPMMPNLGQGGCQAIEDAYELTRALQAVTVRGRPTSPEATREALQSFYGRRVGRVAGVSLLSRLASDLIVNFFDTPWSPHDEKGQSPLSYLTFAWKPLLQYIIFPIQFLFLYSCTPRDIPVTAWTHVCAMQHAAMTPSVCCTLDFLQKPSHPWIAPCPDHPTGGMGELPKQLEAAWRDRQRPAAEAAFKQAKEQGQQTASESFFAATRT